jgi:hypothetical protein
MWRTEIAVLVSEPGWNVILPAIREVGLHLHPVGQQNLRGRWHGGLHTTYQGTSHERWKRNETQWYRMHPASTWNWVEWSKSGSPKPTDWLAILAILGIGGNTIVIHYSNELTFGTTVGDHHPLQVFSIYYGYIVPELHFSCCAWVSLVGLLYDQDKSSSSLHCDATSFPRIMQFHRYSEEVGTCGHMTELWWTLRTTVGTHTKRSCRY